MDTTQWPQGINGVVKPMEGSRPISLERKIRPQKDQALNCPRCNSTNTKFCYYNNYSLSQPRYFCKTCRRYWTEGGSLRNVPVGGGSRKNKRSSSSSSSSIILSNSSKNLLDLTTQQGNNPNNKIHEGQDLNLAYNQPSSDFIELPFGIGTKTHNLLVNPNSSSSSSHIMSSRATLGSFMSNLLPVADLNTVFSSGFSLQEFKPSNLNFSLEGFESNGHVNSVQESSGARLLFPTEEPKAVPSNTEFEQSRGQGDTSGFWKGLY